MEKKYLWWNTVYGFLVFLLGFSGLLYTGFVYWWHTGRIYVAATIFLMILILILILSYSIDALVLRSHQNHKKLVNTGDFFVNPGPEVFRDDYINWSVVFTKIYIFIFIVFFCFMYDQYILYRAVPFFALFYLPYIWFTRSYQIIVDEEHIYFFEGEYYLWMEIPLDRITTIKLGKGKKSNMFTLFGDIHILPGGPSLKRTKLDRPIFLMIKTTEGQKHEIYTQRPRELKEILENQIDK